MFIKKTEECQRDSLKLNLREMLSYDTMPELYYQSYEDLTHNGSEIMKNYIESRDGGLRKKIMLKSIFLKEHSRGDGCRVEEMRKLKEFDKEVFSYAMSGSSPELTVAIRSLIEYKKKEYKCINALSKTHDPTVRDKYEPIYRVSYLNRALYNGIDWSLFYAALNMVTRSMREAKNPKLRKELMVLLNEAIGSDWAKLAEEAGDLPRLNNEAVEAIRRFIEKNWGYVNCLIGELWQKKASSVNGNYAAGPEDIAEFFRLAINVLDPDNEAGIRVIVKEGLSSLSWNSGEKAIVIGKNRPPIKSQKVLFGKIVHELLVHGQRSVAGASIHPILGVGLYAIESYLPFEEGLATIMEKVFKNGSMEWSMSDISLYLNCGLASICVSFDDIYDINWRLRVIEKLIKKNEANKTMTAEEIAKEKRLAYNSVVRVFRGIPIHLPEVSGLFYGKEKTYLEGKVKVIEYLNNNLDDKFDLGVLLIGKFDPTNEHHVRIVNALL